MILYDFIDRLRRSLRAKLILTFSALVVLSVALSAAAGIVLLGTAIRRQAQDKVRQDLNGVIEVYQKEGQRIAAAVELIAQGLSAGQLAGGHGRSWERYWREAISEKGLDFVSLTDEAGRVIYRPLNPGARGDRYPNDIARWVQWSKKTVISSERFSQGQLEREGGDLSARARIVTADTSRSAEQGRFHQSDGLMLVAASPVKDDKNRILGIVFGGVLLNGNEELVDRAQRMLYRQERYQGRDLGTVTIFLDDYRIATNVTTAQGKRALGTRVSEQVYRQVMERGSRWVGRAYVLDAWRIAAYEPIRDISGRPIGMLYAGILEAPFVRLRNKVVMVYLAIAVLTVAALVLVVNWASGRIIRPVRELVAATEEIARGNLGYRVPVKGQDEIGQLGDSFNRMSAELKRVTDGYLELNRTLEQKVVQRTKELEAARDSLVQTEKLSSLGRMAAGIAHEINNPLTSIMLNSHLMKEKLPKNSRLHEPLDLIIEETARSSAIVKGMLEFSRQTVSHLRPTDINRALEKTLRLLDSQLMMQKVSVSTDLSEELPQVPADEGKLRQVFTNIILNAGDAMPQGGRLEIATKWDGERRKVRISFADQGSGIPREVLPKIFDPFFSTKGIKGTGLGLAISYGIIKQHGGEIEVQSREGRGTVFTVVLPLERNQI